jgi:diguanylate cyclase (GGDEF)-like protein/PAS domain S-box-containing protein
MDHPTDDPARQLSFSQSLSNRHLERDQKRLLSTLLDQLEGMVYRCRNDASWTMEFVSVGCLALTGYSPDDLLLNNRISYDEITHPEDRERVRAEIHSAISTRRRFEVQYRILRADGMQRWVCERGTGIFHQNGMLEALQGFIEDITQRQENEHALRDAETRYRDIVENAAEGIFQTTMEGRYIKGNPALARIYGYESFAEMTAALADIGTQLYVDGNRRAEFMRTIRQHGAVTNFESQVYRKSGDIIWISENAREVRDVSGNTIYYEGTVEDITERKTYEMQLAHQATHDALTGLPNRALFADRMRKAMPLAERTGSLVAAAFLDLDNFKYINDSLGHEAGDAVIRVIAKRLQSCVRESDTVARLGGDEFVLLLQGLHAGSDEVTTTMSRILAEVCRPLMAGKHELTITCSLGISLYPQDGRDVDTLLKHADAAMYQAKHMGRNNFQFFTSSLNQRARDRLDLEHSLRQAVEKNEFILHYQPKIDLRSGSILGSEALIRWKGPRGLVSPARFIPVAEEIGSIESIGEWVLESACRQSRLWQERGLHPFTIAVNFSPRQFTNNQLPQLVESILRRTNVDPGMLEIEITESCLASEPDKFIIKLAALKALGLQLSIDDFGVGYSSMAYLKSFPLDRLKVDRTFVTNLTTSAKDQAIFKAILSLGHNLGLRVVAEGVETAEQYYFLRDVGCDEVQGYFFSMPVPVADYEVLLDAQISTPAPGRGG